MSRLFTPRVVLPLAFAVFLAACGEATASAAPEVCDGIDNDLDGVVDEGNPGGGGACDSGQPGVCQEGTLQCEGGGLACVPSASPIAEVCNGLDDDCDGQPDEGNPGGNASCDTGQPGVCAAGTTSCANGQISCEQNTQPSAETCNGLDDDCDGQADEGNPGGGGACSTGLPGVCAAGTASCSNGGLVCEQNSQPSAETCNGLDDDCDGQADEGNPGGGAACSTGLQGVCAAGTTSCSNGGLVCEQNTQPSAETCNGLDDDCDGQADEGNPGGGAACSTGLQGVCAAGTTSCSNGGLVCEQNTQPSAEACDGLDNDCDGQVDEGCPASVAALQGQGSSR